MDITIGQILLIGFFGMLGTISRYLLSTWTDARFAHTTFPTGTFVVNLTGCLLAGFLFHILMEKYAVDPIVRTYVLIGFLGGYTTFSSYAIQSLALMRDGEMFKAAMNIIASNAGGLLMTWLGYSLSKAAMR